MADSFDRKVTGFIPHLQGSTAPTIPTWAIAFASVAVGGIVGLAA